VFLDPASPITYSSISNNGQETVATETANLSVTSSFTPRLISHFRAQFSRDQQQSYSNTNDVLIKIPTILDGLGRSNILPRQTREHRLHVAETVSLEGARHSWKFGGDGLFTRIYDFFPSRQSGQYLFYPIKAATDRNDVSHFRFHRLNLRGRILSGRFLRDLAVQPHRRLSVAALHQSSGPSDRTTGQYR
jgi:hypothetical protein